MSEDQFESLPRVKRFAAVPREAVNGKIVVQVIVELQSETGVVTSMTGTMNPQDAIDNGTALAKIGTAVQPTKYNHS